MKPTKTYEPTTYFHTRRALPLFALAGLFLLLLFRIWPEGCFYGSSTDWLSQHVRLAETIRNACVEQKTLVPAFLPLGGGINGYQVAYYGYLRPDILLGCLFPDVPMVHFVSGYAILGAFVSVFLCRYWLILNQIDRPTAFWGSILFMAAASFFHVHRQIMFINYMPFLMLALIIVRKACFKTEDSVRVSTPSRALSLRMVCLLSLCMLLIFLNSFYYSISCFAVIGWYWLTLEGKAFWKRGAGAVKFICASLLSVGMAAILLLPTGLAILEHKRPSGILRFSDVFQNIRPDALLYSPYGIGVTAVCLYALLLGLAHRKYRRESLFLLFICFCSAVSWILNGTLYARPKILIPFLPLVILQCMHILQALFHREIEWRIWPFGALAVLLLLWKMTGDFSFLDSIDKDLVKWVLADWGLLALFTSGQVCMQRRRATHTANSVCHSRVRTPSGSLRQNNKIYAALGLLCIIPCILFVKISQTEDFVKTEDVFAIPGTFKTTETLCRYDSLATALNIGNLANSNGLPKSSVYTSVSNADYGDFYYDVMQTPIQINNRLAILPSANPFLLNLLGIRYLETTDDQIPYGYQPVSNTDAPEQSNAQSKKILVENETVLPIAYVTNACLAESKFETLTDKQQLDAMTRYTIIPDEQEASAEQKASCAAAASKTNPIFPVAMASETFSEVKPWTPDFGKRELPENMKITREANGYLMNISKKTTVTLPLKAPVLNQILLLDFEVDNRGKNAVVIDINGIRNKLSGTSAAYPNGNDVFHYQLSTASERGMEKIKVTFSKGFYCLKNINWYSYDTENLSKKPYTKVELTESDTTSEEQTTENAGTLLHFTATADEHSCLVTSIPFQNGMEILVDGETVPIQKVNTAFLGAKLTEGSHEIRIVFHAPGQATGKFISLCSLILWVILFYLSSRYINKLRKC